MVGSALARNMGGEEADVIRQLVQRVCILITKVNSDLFIKLTPNNIHYPGLVAIAVQYSNVTLS